MLRNIKITLLLMLVISTLNLRSQPTPEPCNMFIQLLNPDSLPAVNELNEYYGFYSLVAFNDEKQIRPFQNYSCWNCFPVPGLGDSDTSLIKIPLPITHLIYTYMGEQMKINFLNFPENLKYESLFLDSLIFQAGEFDYDYHLKTPFLKPSKYKETEKVYNYGRKLGNRRFYYDHHGNYKETLNADRYLCGYVSNLSYSDEFLKLIKTLGLKIIETSDYCTQLPVPIKRSNFVVLSKMDDSDFDIRFCPELAELRRHYHSSGFGYLIKDDEGIRALGYRITMWEKYHDQDSRRQMKWLFQRLRMGHYSSNYNKDKIVWVASGNIDWSLLQMNEAMEAIIESGLFKHIKLDKIRIPCSEK